jgi:hypothetical protein
MNEKPERYRSGFFVNDLLSVNAYLMTKVSGIEWFMVISFDIVCIIE